MESWLTLTAESGRSCDLKTGWRLRLCHSMQATIVHRPQIESLASLFHVYSISAMAIQGIIMGSWLQNLGGSWDEGAIGTRMGTSSASATKPGLGPGRRLRLRRRAAPCPDNLLLPFPSHSSACRSALELNSL
jgi:hypothetical protein